MSTPRTLVFVPTYEERGNAGEMVSQLSSLGLDADLLFVDDASPDGTGDLLDELAKTHPRLTVLHRSGKLGIGSAHQDGLAWAFDRGYERLVTMDCDFTHAPADVPRLLEGSRDADLVVGSRFLASGSLPGWSPHRRALTHLGHLVTSTALGLPHDASSAFRVYRLDRIPRELFGLVRSRGYAFFFESLFVLAKNGVRVAEVPIVLPARAEGRSKMDLREVVRSARTALGLAARHARDPASFKLPRDER
jgi:dolichol-phosphate mannosyltransferase